MSNNNLNINQPVIISKITIFLISIYIVLFEFIWVTQSIIPKPSLLFDSFISLWSDYNLLNAFFETTAVIFPAILIAIVVLEIFAKLFLKTLIDYSGIINIVTPFKYFSFFFFALLLNFVFQESLLAEILFAILFVISKLLTSVFNEKNFAEEEYILSAQSLGLSKSQIYSIVVWKSLKPNVYKNLTKVHMQLWVAVLIYEFIGASIGMGAVYRLAYNYNDVLSLISLGIFISFVILIVNSIIKMVVSKLIFWK